MAHHPNSNPAADYKITHSDIQLKFGSERAIEYNFATRDRNWSCLRNLTIETNRTI